MFKLKKTDLPARPQPPSWEQMEEDLKVAEKSDIIFTLSPSTAGLKEKTDLPEKNTSGNDTDVTKDYINNEERFQQAVEFVEKNDELINNMKLLNDKRERLEEVSNNLKLTVESVKKQALVAIDGY